MIGDKYSCDGQMDIYDYIENPSEKEPENTGRKRRGKKPRRKKRKRRRGEHYGYYWQPSVTDMIRSYDKLSDPSYGMVNLNRAYKRAIDEALACVGEQEDGMWKLKAIRMRYLQNTPEKTGVIAQYVHASERTVETWCADFVYDVGIRADRLIMLRKSVDK